jgi:membrane-bound lytic murein transglycosylase D
MSRYLTAALFCLISTVLAAPSYATVPPEAVEAPCTIDVEDGSPLKSKEYQTFLIRFGLCQDRSHLSHFDVNSPFFDGFNSEGKTSHPASLTREERSKEVTYDIPVIINERVEHFLDYFQTRGRGFFERWLARSTKYLPMVKEILRQNGLPEDLAYLALIESGFNTRAYSRASAAGIWQFMPKTGERYDLRIDWWIDERRNPEKSTWAAAAYLKNLYAMFDSWYLAAAGYNGGEGRVKRAIKRHQTDDFWVMSKKRKGLKRETRDYIPKFIAAMLIAKEPEKYGFTNIEYSEAVAYDKVNVPEATDLRVIAGASGCSLQEITELNPDLNRWFTPPNYPEYEITLPKGMGKTFQQNLASIPRQERLKFLRHKVQRGDSLLSIARRYGTTIDPIVYLNEIKNPRFIKAGWLLVIPVRADSGIRKIVRRAPLPKDGIYLVQRGDTLWEISLRFGVKVRELLEWNKIERVDRLMPGQRIYVKRSRT